MRYCSNDCNKVYAFEPLSGQIDIIKKRCTEHEWQNVEIINAAAWVLKDLLHFQENTTGSTVCSSGSSVVQAIDIDTIVGDEHVTFIKMDIEGAELQALQGARNTILKNKPTLAICVYHKVWDFIDIPLYIISLNPGYRFYLMHYSSMCTETVLYAAAE